MDSPLQVRRPVARGIADGAAMSFPLASKKSPKRSLSGEMNATPKAVESWGLALLATCA